MSFPFFWSCICCHYVLPFCQLGPRLIPGIFTHCTGPRAAPTKKGIGFVDEQHQTSPAKSFATKKKGWEHLGWETFAETGVVFVVYKTFLGGMEMWQKRCFARNHYSNTRQPNNMVRPGKNGLATYPLSNKIRPKHFYLWPFSLRSKVVS